jgi:menaquinone-specific isochorismate synthase
MPEDARTATDSPRTSPEAAEDRRMIGVIEPMQEPADPVSLFSGALAAGGPSFFWARPSADVWMVGLGDAAGAAFDGPRVLQDVSELRRGLLAAADVEGDGPPGTGPIVFGAFRFDPSSTPGPPWDSGRAHHVLVPETLYTQISGGAWISSTAAANPADLVEAQARLRGRRPAPLHVPAAPERFPRLVRWQETSRARWTRSVRRIMEGIGSGWMEKATLARNVRLAFEGPLPVDRILRRLVSSYPDCRIFAVSDGARCFLGATPELLVSQDDGRVRSVCLAGSAPRTSDPSADDGMGLFLLGDSKERWEHEIVVRWIAHRMAAWTSSLTWNRTPRVMRLPAVQHLETVFEGTVPAGRDAFELVSAIHPTPAVGGSPLAAALPLLREEEELDRGWYAGPVGWMDRGGDGEVGLAIRSALIRGDEACLFAGAGIVAGSDPEKEWQEVEWKFTPLLSALGLASTFRR